MEPFATIEALREARARIDANLPHACDIQVDVGTTVAGAQRASWQSAAGGPVSCSLTTLGAGNDSMREDQNQRIETYTVRFSLGTVVTDKNRLVVTGVNALTGEAFSCTLMVTSIVSPSVVALLVRARDATAAEK